MKGIPLCSAALQFTFLLLSTVTLVAQEDRLVGIWVSDTSAVTITRESSGYRLETTNKRIFTGPSLAGRVEFAEVVSSATPDEVRRFHAEGKPVKINATQPSEHKLTLLTLIPRRTGEPQSVEQQFSRVEFELTDGFGQKVDRATSFSKPHPVVQLEEVQASGISANGRLATVTVRGTVRDPVADIVIDGSADLKTVVISFPRSDDDGRTRYVEQQVPLQRIEDEKSARRPNAFRARFQTQIQVPLEYGDVLVTATATNAIGNLGSDSFTLQLEDAPWPTDGPMPPAKIVGVLNHPSTSSGLVNAVSLRITDHSLSPGAMVSRTARIDGTQVNLRSDQGATYLDRPIMAIARAKNLPAANIVDVTASESTTIAYRGAKVTIDWIFTSQAYGDSEVTIASAMSPDPLGFSRSRDFPVVPFLLQRREAVDINFFKYAAGTLVDMRLHGAVFSELQLRTVEALYLRPDGLVQGELRYRQETVPMRVLETDRLSTLVRVPGYRVRLQLPRDTGRLGLYRLRLTLGRPGETREYFVQTAEFEIVGLRHVIFAVDGLGRRSLEAVLGRPDDADGIGVRELFLDSESRKFTAYSALPSITFTNWPGVFSGSNPARHGIQGNSFLARELSEEFASTGGWWASAVRGLGVTVFGSLNRHARPAVGSIYDSIADASSRNIHAASIHAFFDRSSDGRVRLHRDRLAPNPAYMGHSEAAGTRLDENSGEDASRYYRANRDSLDVLTIYLPGPDNLAHTIGQQGNTPEVTSGWYRMGPRLPEVDNPLNAAADHQARVTNQEIRRVTAEIREAGYLPATLFAIVSDHGLHAFRNEDPFNIGPRDFGRLFDDVLRIRLWTGGIQSFVGSRAALSANGGMAHIYIRDEIQLVSNEQAWKRPADPATIQTVAAQLYLEAVGGVTRNAAGAIVNLPECNETRRTECVARVASLAPNPTGATAHHGLLGSPPAIFIRACEQLMSNSGASPRNHWEADFQWVRSASADRTQVQCVPISDFIRERAAAERSQGRPGTFQWPELAERLAEMTDKSAGGSRTGDIIIVSDGRAGFLLVNSGDAMNGWHGGPTVSESEVPVYINMVRGPVVATFRDNLISQTMTEIASRRPSRSLRNWELKDLIVSVIRRLR